jgi:hypothetical protein
VVSSTVVVGACVVVSSKHKQQLLL